MKFFKVLKIFFLGFTFCVAPTLFSINSKDLEKISWIVEKVDNFYKKNPKLKGNFTLYQDGKKSEGYFLFEAPSKLKMFFGPEEESNDSEKFRYIISNGSVLWIFLPQAKVLVEQEIPDYFKDMGMLGMGISRLLGSYRHLTTAEEDKDGEKLTLLTLKNPSKNMPFQEITFTINQEGFITMMRGKAIKNNKQQITTFFRYGLNKNPEFTDRDFRVRPSGDIQILRNVLVKTKK